MKTLADFQAVYHLPLPELIFRALEVHRQHHDAADIQRCALLSIKTGGCAEDCGYCAQSAYFKTGVPSTPLMDLDEVRAKAVKAKELGATRFCMGTAWREPKDGPGFDRILDMVRLVRELDMEACVTLGMLTDDQAQRFANAGLTAYNHNLDTSRRHYPNVITTRTYDDRLRTLNAVQKSGVAVCCGGILGMGEEEDDRLMLLSELAHLEPPPESIPINCLVPIAGTPLENAEPVDSIELVRMIATTRIAFPKARVRLSAGRDKMSRELQILCFLAGANSIFFGEKLLTAPNPSADGDAALFRAMGLPVFEGERVMTLEERWQAQLDSLREQGRYRTLKKQHGIDFSSNDYLGYGKRFWQNAANLLRSGQASRLLRGHHEIWEEVETRLAEWHGAEAALMMTSGYVANEGLLSTVIEPQDWVASDEFNHASIVDGIRLSKAEKFIFRHNDDAEFLAALRSAQENRGQTSEFFLVTESYFGMDADSACLMGVLELWGLMEAHAIIDEAHATGCFGPEGSGMVNAMRLRDRAPVLATVHTGGKALGVPGAYICCSKALKDYLINRCRHFIFTTALPPMVGQWWLDAFEKVKRDETARGRLHENAEILRGALTRAGVKVEGRHFIVPIILGDDVAAVRAAEALQKQGFDVRAIRPPTVPPGTARLRVSIHADHERAQLLALAEAAARVVTS